MISPSITSPTILGTAILASGAILNLSSGTLTLGANNKIIVANGGTGATTLTGIVKGNGTSSFTASTVVAVTDGGTGLSSAPVQTILLSMAGGWASATSGDAGFTSVGTTSGITYMGTKFITTISSYSYHEFAASMPDNWDLGTITARPYFFTSGATSNQTIVLGLQGVSMSDGDAIASYFGTAGEVAVTTSNNIAGELTKGASTSAITIGGSPAKGDWTQFRSYRGGTTDTFSGDVVVLGWHVSYTTSGYSAV